MPRIVAVCQSAKCGTVKTPVDEGFLVEDHGLRGDAHAGTGRQVSLLCTESVRTMEGRGVDLPPGVFAENLLVEGMRAADVAVGQIFALPSGARLEVTQIGKPCHQGCEIRRIVGDCVMPREGFFVRVLTGGAVRAGDALERETGGG